MSEPPSDLSPGGALRSIEAYVSAYLPEMVDLWVASWQQTMPAIDFEARRGWLVDHLGALQAGGVVILVALTDTGDLAGFVTIDPTNGHLDQICVGPAWWGRGIAEALLNAARARSPGSLHLDVNADNPRAIAFYRRQGFVETGRSTNPRSGLPIVAMRWIRAEHAL